MVDSIINDLPQSAQTTAWTQKVERRRKPKPSAQRKNMKIAHFFKQFPYHKRD